MSRRLVAWPTRRRKERHRKYCKRKGRTVRPTHDGERYER